MKNKEKKTKKNKNKKTKKEIPSKNVWHSVPTIAHRGLHNTQAPENTIAACARALEAGHAIEFDVQVLRDETVVLFHDRMMDRMTVGTGPVRQCTYERIRMYFVGDSHEKVPRLQHALELVDGRVPLLIELKTTFFRAQKDVRVLARALSAYKGECCVASSDPSVVRWWSLHDAPIPAGQIFHDETFVHRWLCIMAWILYGRPGSVLLVGVQSVRRMFFQRVRRAGSPLLAWTICNDADLSHVRADVDGVIFDAGNNFTIDTI